MNEESDNNEDHEREDEGSEKTNPEASKPLPDTEPAPSGSITKATNVTSKPKSKKRKVKQLSESNDSNQTETVTVKTKKPKKSKPSKGISLTRMEAYGMHNQVERIKKMRGKKKK